MYRQDCKEDEASWIEVQQQFDKDGLLHIAVNEMIPDHLNSGFKEQCVHLTRLQIEGLIAHLRKAVDSKNFGEVDESKRRTETTSEVVERKM